MNAHYQSLRHLVQGRPDLDWLNPLIDESESIVGGQRHGDLPAWRDALAKLPEVRTACDGNRAAPELGKDVADREATIRTLMKLHPWRKGPLRLGGIGIDTEWRSDLKWQRIAPHLDLRGHRILDIGAGNGYYGWRMLGAGADLVIGFDPTLVFVMQWMACRHFAGDLYNYVLPLGVERIPPNVGGFDSVFSMGVLYHRRDPVSHLRRLRKLASPGGSVVLETLILEEEEEVLVPEGRYARMRNVWAVPTLDHLVAWMREAGLNDIELLDVTRTTVEEQRSTKWMRFESLRECLDPDNPDLTIEGYPAPVRAALVARC